MIFSSILNWWCWLPCIFASSSASTSKAFSRLPRYKPYTWIILIHMLCKTHQRQEANPHPSLNGIDIRIAERNPYRRCNTCNIPQQRLHPEDNTKAAPLISRLFCAISVSITFKVTAAVKNIADNMQVTDGIFYHWQLDTNKSARPYSTVFDNFAVLILLVKAVFISVFHYVSKTFR